MEVLCLLGAAGNELPGQPLAGCVHILTAFFLCSGDQLPEIGLAHFHPRLRRIPLFLQASRKAVAFRCPLFQLLIVGPHLLGVEFQAAEDILSGLFTQLRCAAGVSGGGYRLVECIADLLRHLPVSLGCIILSQPPELSHICDQSAKCGQLFFLTLCGKPGGVFRQASDALAHRVFICLILRLHLSEKFIDGIAAGVFALGRRCLFSVIQAAFLPFQYVPPYPQPG